MERLDRSDRCSDKQRAKGEKRNKEAVGRLDRSDRCSDKQRTKGEKGRPKGHKRRVKLQVHQDTRIYMHNIR